MDDPALTVENKFASNESWCPKHGLIKWDTIKFNPQSSYSRTFCLVCLIEALENCGVCKTTNDYSGIV